MKTQKFSTWLALPLIVLFWAGTANAVSVTGIAVDGGPGNTTRVGIADDTTGEITYFIPLNSGDAGTYAESPPNFCTEGVGTCKDYGSGYGYNTATSLAMNIFFPLITPPEIAAAELVIKFEDLDLTPINDPKTSRVTFYESLTFSYWDTDKDGGAGYDQIGGVIKDVNDLTSGDFGSGKASTDPITPIDPFSWKLDLAELMILGDLNDSLNAHGGLWIQLGFGSNFCYDGQDPDATAGNVCTKRGGNTAEYLTASLTVSPVPLPSAVWLFGSALVGFIGMSRRTRV